MCQSGFCPPGEFHSVALAVDQQRFDLDASLKTVWPRKLIHNDLANYESVNDVRLFRVLINADIPDVFQIRWEQK